MHTDIKALLSVLANDTKLTKHLVVPIEGTVLPFKQLKDVEFVVLTSLVRSDASYETDLAPLIERIVMLSKEFLQGSQYWGIEILICRDTGQHYRKTVRLTIPRPCISQFSHAQIPHSNQQFEDKKVGCIWYESLPASSPTTQ